MDILSPLQIVKGNVLAVQDYSQLAGRAVQNVFRKPRYVADTLQQADLIGVGSLRHLSDES